jgi:predicted DNA-binding protein (MmcQ/YjbR family)
MGDVIDRVRALCTALPEVAEKVSHGEPAWFVRKRMFVMFADRHHDDRVGFWCAAPPGTQEELVDDVRYFRPPYVGHRGWLGVYLDVPVDWDEVAEVVEEAYRTIAPTSLGAQLSQR